MNREAEMTTATRSNAAPVASTTHTDAALLDAIAQKQDWALSELYDRYSSVLYTLALKILGEPTPAQDVLQETFLAAWRKADLYNQKRGNVGTWLIVLCRNLAIDH